MPLEGAQGLTESRWATTRAPYQLKLSLVYESLRPVEDELAVEVASALLREGVFRIGVSSLLRRSSKCHGSEGGTS